MRTISAIVVGIAVICWSAEIHAASKTSQPVHTNKTRFRIPYSFNVEEMRAIGAREIRLYLSVDRGARWRQIQSVSPSVGRFDFQAPQDGEYWFAVRTVDAQNQLHPQEAAIQPGLKVIVDTKQPTLSIKLKQSQPGTVQLEWTASDAHLNTGTLQLDYIQSGWENWKRVAIAPQKTGRTSWKVRGGGLVAVRGRVSDNASNLVTAQNRVEIIPSDTETPKSTIPDFSKPIASTGTADEQSSQIPETTSPQNPNGISLPPVPTDPVVDREARSSGQPVLSGPQAPTPGFNKPEISKDGTDISENNIVSKTRDTQNSPVSEDSSNRPQSNASERSPPGTTRRSFRIGNNTRVVNSHKFQIGYRIDDVGPSGIGRVELYISQNHGKKWFKYGEDSDRTSPFEVEVPKDGRYGFTLRASNGLGLSSQPPQPGETPAISVIVDKTPPLVELFPIQQGRGNQLNQISIRWKVTDEYPAQKSISLSYSTDPNGTWEPISGWMNNSGNYLWTTGPGIPPRIYIRLIARDAAGNTTRTATREPLIVDLSRPAARIVDVQSIETSPRR